MPLRSRIVYDLPPELREELEQRIIRDGYSRYAAHADWLMERGHAISQASLQRYGRNLQQIERIRIATREATALRDSTADDGQLADATIRLLQTALHDVIQQHGDRANRGDDSILPAIRRDILALASAGRAVADLSRASRAVRDERRLTAAEAAEAAGNAARNAGVSADVEAAIRRAIESSTPRVNAD